MANLRENAAWESGIYQLETTDPVVGGVDGISNKQAIQLANRTSYLKGEIESLKSNSNAQLVLKRDISDSYSKGEVNALLAPKLDTVAAEAAYMKKTDASSFLQTTQRALISEYAHAANGQTLPDGDYSSPDFWFSIKPGIYYAVSEKGRNKPAAYGLVEIVSNGEVSITWSYWGEVWKWYQTFGKNNSGWKKVVFGDVTPEARANSIVARDGNADFEARYVAATSFKSNANVDDARINAQSEIMFRDPSDKFLRPTSLAKFKEVINGVDFACQKDPNGYTKLPNGLILQWGTTTAVDVIFPIAFNKRLNVSLTSAENECEFAVAVVDEAKIENPSNTGFKIGVRRIAGTTPDWFKFYWFAIGY